MELIYLMWNWQNGIDPMSVGQIAVKCFVLVGNIPIGSLRC